MEHHFNFRERKSHFRELKFGEIIVSSFSLLILLGDEYFGMNGFKYSLVLIVKIALNCWFLGFRIYLIIRYTEQILKGAPILGQNDMTTIHDVDIIC